MQKYPNSVADFKILNPLANERKRKINSVYLVEHKLSGLKGILKHLQKSNKNKHLAQFLRNEASFDFNSDFLPKTLAFLESEDEILLVKSYAEGIPLTDYWKNIPKKSRISFVEALITKLLPIGKELSELGIVHGDFKPDNFILNGTGLEFELSLIDFGLAFYPKGNPQRNIIFSLGYSPPELILNRLDLAQHTSDIYAFGICLYQLFSGKLPLVHPNPAIMTNLQLTLPIPENSAIPKKISRLIEKCCAKKSFPKPPNMLSEDVIKVLLVSGIEMRYQSFDEMLIDLEQHSDNTGLWNRLIKIFSKA